MQNRSFFLSLFFLLALLILVYSNHFHNSFHFDDSHTITNNIFIKEIKNIPLFFKDASTFSSLPSNQSYRPVVSTTLAVDHWLGGGLDPFYFHLSTFVLFLLQGVLLFFLFRKIFSFPPDRIQFSFVALLATAWYLFHPANAETINYIIARGDSISSLFVLLAFAMYIFSPISRKYLLYLIPVIIGALAKIPAIMFAPLLFVYIILFEKKLSVFEILQKKNVPQLTSAAASALPSFLVSAALYFFIQKMEPHWEPGGTSPWHYFISQPYVIFHYVKTFFFPLWLSADTDWAPFDSLLNLKAIFGFIFCGALFLAAVLSSKSPKLRPVSFGIFWFFIALVPTSSIIPLSEVMNDHRVFFPYIGLSMAAGWSIYLLMERIKIPETIALLLCMVVVSVYGYGTYERNKVWHTDESLWRDVTEKSPGNARGLMNYGLALMAKADYKGAEDYFNRAVKIWPYYSYLHINMGVLYAATGRPKEAEQYFLNAISYRKDLPETYYYYARFLNEQDRAGEAMQMLNKTLQLSPGHAMALDLKKAVSVRAADSQRSKLERALEASVKDPSPETFLALSLEWYTTGNFDECIRAAEQALKLKPDYDLAYNNICSAYNMLGKWDQAIEAGEKAVALNPSSQLAKNNLEWARKQKLKAN